MPANSRQLPFTILGIEYIPASPKNSLVHLRSWLVCCFGCFGGVQVTFQLCLDHLAEKQRAAQPRTAQRCAHHVSIFLRLLLKFFALQGGLFIQRLRQEPDLWLKLTLGCALLKYQPKNCRSSINRFESF